MTDRYVFVVDTDQYSGGYCRELCGYLTGRTDDPLTHGGVEAEIAEKELSPEAWDYFQNHVMLCTECPDDVPSEMPSMGYPTPGWFNHGMGGHFRHGQEKEAFEDYKKEIEKYVRQHPGTSLKAGDKLNKCPAYMSVGIFFDEEPPKHIIDILKERAHKFAKEYWPKHRAFGHKLDVTGFRIIREKTVSEEKTV
jgi:hypothetical protein